MYLSGSVNYRGSWKFWKNQAYMYSGREGDRQDRETGPQQYVGKTKGRGLDALRGIKEQNSNRQMKVLPTKIEDRTINNAK